MPLSHFGKTRSRLLGSLAPCGEVDWFGRVPADRLEIVSLRMMSAREREGLAGARATRPFVPSEEKGGRRFIVYEGGKARA